jgi:hypothetical protein
LTCSTVDLDQYDVRRTVFISMCQRWYVGIVNSLPEPQGLGTSFHRQHGETQVPTYHQGSVQNLAALFAFRARCAVYRVLGRHEVAQEPSGSGEYTGPTTFLRTSKPPKEGDGAKGVRSGVSAGRLAGGAPVGLGQVRRAKARKASQQRKPSARRCPRVLDSRLRGNRPSFDSSELGRSLPRKPSSLTKGMLRPAPRCLRVRGVRV